MKPNLTGALIVLAIILFFVGRFTAPVKTVEDRRKIDSLTHDLTKAIKARDHAIDSMNHFRIMADTWYDKYIQETKVKSVSHTVYDNRTKDIDRLTDPQLDSAFRAVYPDK